MNKHTYVKRLKKAGYVVVGGGLYSTVLGKPSSDCVVKVASRDIWPQYIAWATKEGYAGTFAPKVYSLKFFDDFYVAVMERLVATMGEFRTLKWNNGVRCTFLELYSEMCDKNTGCEDLDQFMVKLDNANFLTDFHPGNVMVRRDGQLVVIDPSSRFSTSRCRIHKSTVVHMDP